MQNMIFIADLIASSTCFGHHLPIIRSSRILYKWLLPVVFGTLVFKLSVWCGAEGYVSGLRAAAAGSNLLYNTVELLMMGKWCPKHVEQAIRSAIKSSVASSWHFISTHQAKVSENECSHLVQQNMEINCAFVSSFYVNNKDARYKCSNKTNIFSYYLYSCDPRLTFWFVQYYYALLCNKTLQCL